MNLRKLEIRSSPSRLARAEEDLEQLHALIPRENGLAVFDAETQETSYGILYEDDLPFIFDTHEKNGRFVATVEVLTEVVRPVAVSTRTVSAFGQSAARLGVLSLPYSGCFFKGNLHVYSYHGRVRGLDLALSRGSKEGSERTLRERFHRVWPSVPEPICQAQRDLLSGRRAARHAADLQVLRRRARVDRAL